ncbi:MAG: ATP-dependent RNA helicase dbp2 [Chaenotheca gracillima]|nr:MAG: ATP-dependent RNA helicase dbp2 [Chaenotheca gracillima]
MHNDAPVTNGGGDTTETAQQAQTVRKWASLWRSLILSSMGEALYPYSHFVRKLNLQDLRYLFEEPRFRGATEQHFFAGPLARFKTVMDTPSKPKTRAKAAKRLDIGIMVDAIGEVITQDTPLLEDLSGDISPSALTRWSARLTRLQTLDLWRGKSLTEGAEKSIHDNCPHFKKLTIYEWLGDDADAKLALFLRSLRPNTLELFEIFSYSDIGTEGYSALNHHQQSLKVLRLSNLKAESLTALPMLKECTSIETLFLGDLMGTLDLESGENDVFISIIAWLRQCKGLRHITLQKFYNAASIMTPVLLEDNIRLESIEIQGYKMVGVQLFHHALFHQQTLESVHLQADAEHMLPRELQILVEALSKIPNLRDVKLIDISDTFQDDHIKMLARNLPNLQEFWTGGYGISDAIWEDLGRLPQLKTLYFTAVTRFTLEKLLEFISMLGPGNNGLVLSLMNADPDYVLSEDEQILLRNLLREKVEGRFEFVPLRGEIELSPQQICDGSNHSADPDMSEFEGGDSD